MAALAEHSNVYDTALFILQEKGYQLWYDEPREEYWAEKNGWDFVSSSPCGLLGLVAMYELRHPARYVEYWWREPKADLYRSLPSAPTQPYVPIYQTNRDESQGNPSG